MNARSSDRNLLLGIIALQMDFIRRDGLIAAMHAWTLEKARPLSEILVERGDLDPADRSLLENLVDRHIAMHGGDPGASLSSLDSVEPIRIALEPLDDPSIHESLGRLGKAGAGPATAADRDRTATYAGDVEDAAGRYRVIRLHDEGGLGCVFLARDTEIDRDVALKELKSVNAADAQDRARFLQEAEITGNLEHPGIVPVYGKGRHADGRPYYAMRFVRGETYKAAIDRFYKDRASSSEPGGRRLGFQKLLRQFLVVCETMAYAHNRGVIHRDLKPRNILLGPYGETLIADWGLAKIIGGEREFATAAGILRVSSSGDLQPTMAGARFGTPEYMSPEQARGEIERLGPATDIYSLGATLFYLLTGEHSVRGADAAEVLSKVDRGEIRRPRDVRPGVDRALEAICIKATSLRPEDRYASCRALAEDLERWLADQPVLAYPEPFTTGAMRAIRRHRQLVASAAMLLILGVAGLIWHDRLLARENERVERSYRQVSMANEQAEIARDRATKQLLTTRLALKDQFELVSNGLASLAGSEKLRERHSGVMLALFRKLRESYPHDLDIQYDMAEVYRILAMVRRMTRQRDGALEAYRQAAELFTGLVDYPGHKYHSLRGLVQVLTDRGEFHRMSGRTRQAEEDYALALQCCRRLADDPDPSFYRGRLATIFINRSENLMVQRRYSEARAHADEAVRLLEGPSTADPKTGPDQEIIWYLAMALTDRAVAMAALGEGTMAPDFEGALRALMRIPASSIYRRDADCQRALTSSRYAESFAERGALEDARRRFAEAVAILRGLGEGHAEVPYYREELAIALTGLARTDWRGGRVADAAAELDEAHRILDALCRAEADNAQYLSLQARALIVGYRLSTAARKPEEARMRLDRARASLRKALEVDPDRQVDRVELEMIERELVPEANGAGPSRSRPAGTLPAPPG